MKKINGDQTATVSDAITGKELWTFPAPDGLIPAWLVTRIAHNWQSAAWMVLIVSSF